MEPRETFRKITKNPTRFLIILPGIILLYSLIFYFLFFSPNIWKNLFFIQFSGLSILALLGIFYAVILIFALVFISLLLIINFLRQLITHIGKKKKLVALNYYFYSLTPFLIILTQIPFLIIFKGYYNLLGLNFLYIGIFILVLGLHVYYFATALGVGLNLSKIKTIIVGIIYSVLILGLFLFLYYLIFYSQFSYSFLGYLV
jgi:hypothetical protein